MTSVTGDRASQAQCSWMGVTTLLHNIITGNVATYNALKGLQGTYRLWWLVRLWTSRRVRIDVKTGSYTHAELTVTAAVV